MRVLVITPPEDVVTLDEVKAHLKLDENDEDTFLEGALAGVIAHLDGPDGILGRALGQQTLELRTDCFWNARVSRHLLLPCRPVISVEAVTYLDADGAEQPLAATEYELIGDKLAPARPGAWPRTRYHDEAVRVRYRAGYDELPKGIRSAILLMVGDLYRNRSTVTVGAPATKTPMSTTVENLLRPFRVYE